MTPLFLEQCLQKSPMRENRCNYMRVFLLRNIRVQFGCRNWPTQQRISLVAIPHSLREISWLKPQKILLAAPQHKIALQPQCWPNLDCVSPSLSHAGPALAFLGLHQPQEALCQLSGPLRQTHWPLWCFAQHFAASAWTCVSPCWLCVTLLGCCTALPTQSLLSLFLCTQRTSVAHLITNSISPSKPCSRE